MKKPKVVAVQPVRLPTHLYFNKEIHMHLHLTEKGTLSEKSVLCTGSFFVDLGLPNVHHDQTVQSSGVSINHYFSIIILIKTHLFSPVLYKKTPIFRPI